MTLTEAKQIADCPNAFTVEVWREALARLEKSESNGGVRNSERAMRRLERRVRSLRDRILRSACDCQRPAEANGGAAGVSEGCPIHGPLTAQGLR